MRFLIISSDNKLLEDCKQFVWKHFGISSQVYSANSIKQAFELISNHNPEIILAQSRINKQSIYKFIEQFPTRPNRNYFLLQIDKTNAIKAIRLGIRGMFNFNKEQDVLAIAINKSNKNSSIKNLEIQVNQINKTDCCQQSLFIQTNQGFNELKFSNILYIENTNSNLTFTMKKGQALKSNHLLLMVANNLPSETFIVVSPNLIINSSNICSITSLKQGCQIGFEDNSSKQIPNMGLDTLFKMIKESQAIQMH